MLEKVTVKDFQSLSDVSVDLGKFTVLVGQSSSGKSAFMRSIKALTRNTFVPSNVRMGKTKALVVLQLDGGLEIAATRGKSISSYSMGDDKYTKTGKNVPEAISSKLAMPTLADQDFNFSFQFDKPFLLNEPGSRVAAVMGTLTNVSKIHDSVREANRRKIAATADVKATQRLLERARESLGEFDGLDVAETRVASLETSLEELKGLKSEKSSIEASLRAVKGAATKVSEAKKVLSNLPSVDVTTALLEEYLTLKSAMSQVTSAASTVRELRSEVSEAADRLLALEQEYATLVPEEVCPTCGQRIVSDED